MLVAVIDIKIVATTGADLNHLVRNNLKNDFIIFQTIKNKITLNTQASESNVGRFQRIKTLKAVEIYFDAVISCFWGKFRVKCF